MVLATCKPLFVPGALPLTDSGSFFKVLTVFYRPHKPNLVVGKWELVREREREREREPTFKRNDLNHTSP